MADMKQPFILVLLLFFESKTGKQEKGEHET